MKDRNCSSLSAVAAAAAIMGTTETRPGGSRRSSIPPPVHPTYDLQQLIRLALAEDAGDRGDITCLATIGPEIQAQAQFLAKEDGVVGGIAMADLVFSEVDPSLQVEWEMMDGDMVTKGLHFGTVSGSARSILIAERVVLNFMQRMSGIATVTKAMVEAASPSRILETRKTAPGLRLIDKWAVLIGGGENHRMGLYDMVLVKDNHIAVAGGIPQAIAAVDAYLKQENLDVGIEIETRTLEEVQEVISCIERGVGRVTRVLLDNMVVRMPNGDVDVSMLQSAVDLVNSRFETEASGNVTIETVGRIGSTGVTYISSGALTHSVKALDISLNVDTELAVAVAKRTNRA